MSVIRKIAEYRVKLGKIGEAEQAIKAFVAAIAAEEPQTIYSAYRKDDGLSFIHFMAFPNQEAETTHQRAAYTLKFVEALYPNCEEQPRFTDLTLVHSSNPRPESAKSGELAAIPGRSGGEGI